MAIGTACRQAGTPLLKPRSFWFRAFLALYFSVDVELVDFIFFQILKTNRNA
jgi:hypothetical protein